MGYIGLLLNAPYKIDSMVWMRIGFGSYLFLLLVTLFSFWTIRTRGQNRGISPKMGITRVLGF
jgi:hypothetical protein